MADATQRADPAAGARRGELAFALPPALAWLALVVLQAIVVPAGLVGLATSLLVGVGGLGAFLIYLRRDLLRRHPVSTMMMLGYAFYYFWAPPLATLAEFKPLTTNLLHPVLVEFNALVGFVTYSLAMFLYARVGVLHRWRWFLSERLCRPLGFFRDPGDETLFVMGGMALVATLLAAHSGSVGARFLAGFAPMAYLPCAILVGELIGRDPRRARPTSKYLLLIGVYLVALLGLGIALNSRGAAFMGLASIALSYLYGTRAGAIAGRLARPRNMVLGIVALLLVSGPLADLSTAMLVARKDRAVDSMSTLVDQTLEVYHEKAILVAYRLAESRAADAAWDESYVSNPFLSRLCNLKFADESLDLAFGLDNAGDAVVRKSELDKVLSNLPQPVLGALGINAHKDVVSRSSGGDFLLFAATGSPYALGGERTGSTFATAYACFGWFYPLALLPLVLLAFAFGDALTSRVVRAGGSWAPVINPMVICTLYSYTAKLTSAATGVDNVADLLDFSLRDWIQRVILYTMLFLASRALLAMMGRGQAMGRGGR
jgi:hypothetical protein